MLSLIPDVTRERRTSGLVDSAVQPRREQSRDGSARQGGNPEPSRLESTGEISIGWRQHGVRTVNRHRWARRVASGERVKRGQGTRHNDPVTSEEGMPLDVNGLAPLA